MELEGGSRAPGFSRRDLAWLFVGLILCAVLYAIFVFGTVSDPSLLVDGEPGILEHLQAAILFVCLLIDGWLWRRSAGGLRIWLGLIFVALFFILGEEISWGQQMFGWGTPQWFARHNVQDETNLHNSTWLLNQLPRNVLRAAILFGGGFYPVVRRFLRRDPPGVAAWLPPRLGGVAPALFMAITAVVMRFDWPDFLNDDATYFELSEVEELFFYSFFLTYLAGIWRQMKLFGPSADPRGRPGR